MHHLDTVMFNIHQAENKEDLWKVLSKYFTSIGVRMASYHATNADGTPSSIKAQGFPEAWLCKYIEENLVQIDPIPELAARMAKPFYWHDAANLAPTTQDSKRYLELMAQAHVGDGLALYVFGPAMQNAYVGLGFGEQEIDLSPQMIWAIQCVAQAGHLRACVLRAQEKPMVELSRRELEILRWVARGKSNSVIADILTLSPHTVDAHIRRIYAKLNVNDRTSAAIRGIGSGLVLIDA
ncbi:LuxR family transcriptional regulator [uncultured Sulfitobacter sp.]|uniref:helix-turn-helix transcriptional regulator n=1 Tax=uncultured Sulfitobacter sp. TaxID=191468 RepID=UPI002609283C|nr:LuxR family transcriptional regulator [uncultured Sulfitobacter sp.]